ncbi:tail completion protein gp17 [Pseudobacillus badius]|uniref:tail completion protein gp17 n=1 Tax=Bacillus badius TaxID=1455 RepID=UPI0024A4B0D3|nr:hypothetical protein [Bacillus badius]GLY09598.1 hypothetical protein Bbad01_08140 [Bacillus badius]
MINEILKTLEPLGVPVEFQEYTGFATTYITFFFYNEFGSEFADDEEIATDYSLQVDIWSKGGYTALTEKIKAALKEIGYRRSFASDFYEKDTKIYHKVLRFRHTEVLV